MSSLLDHPLWCALGVSLIGYAVAALFLWPWSRR